jgi:hypothetical protein
MGINPQVGGSTAGKSRKLTVNHNPGSPQQQQNQPRASVEEEGASYLSRHGAHKRNTVHALASPLSMLTASQQRYARTPYAKQSPTGTANAERRSSWTSSNNASHLNPQQFSRLESIYSQSIRGSGPSDTQRHSLGAGEHLNSIQQLQIEFQKLQACAERPSLVNSVKTGGLEAPVNAPTISITDENNRSLAPSSTSYDPMAFMAQNVRYLNIYYYYNFMCLVDTIHGQQQHCVETRNCYWILDSKLFNDKQSHRTKLFVPFNHSNKCSSE